MSHGTDASVGTLTEEAIRGMWPLVRYSVLRNVYGFPEKVLSVLSSAIGSAGEDARGDDPMLQRIVTMLLQKNAAYGDSALRPVRVLSKASRVEQLRVRADDKVSRIMRGRPDGEDVAHDLLGYLVLLEIAELLELAEGL